MLPTNPMYFFVDLVEDDKFLIIACDGLWDVISNEKAVQIVDKYPCPVTAATALRDYAHMLGSGDNISVIVYRFDDLITWNDLHLICRKPDEVSASRSMSGPMLTKNKDKVDNRQSSKREGHRSVILSHPSNPLSSTIKYYSTPETPLLLQSKIDASNDAEGDSEKKDNLKLPEVIIDNQYSLQNSLSNQSQGPISDPIQNSLTTTNPRISSKTVPECDSSVSSNG